MSWSRLLVIALSTALLAAPAWGQDDDDLAPLTKKGKPKPKPKPAVKPTVKPKPPAPTTSSDDDLAPLAPVKAQLALRLMAGTPTTRAHVLVDDKDVGTLPMQPLSLNTGEHTIVVRAPGYATWTKKLTIVGTKANELIIPLEATSALVTVTSDVPGAEVLINGKSVGIAPIAELEVPPGQTTIGVRKEGYRESSQTVKLFAGKEYPISAKVGALSAGTAVVADNDRPQNTTLVPSGIDPALTVNTRVEDNSGSRWYVWVGAAAVVAAVAVGVGVGVAVSSNSKPRQLGSSEICHGVCDACIGLACASGIIRF